jgi:hypothetical protein
VATLPVVATLSFLFEVFRFGTSVLRRNETHDAFGTAADLARVTFAIPVATIFERFPVLITFPFVHARTVDATEVTLPPVAASSRRYNGSSVSSANQFWIRTHRRWHNARLGAKWYAVHHAALGANALTVAAIIHLGTDFVSLSVESAVNLVAFPRRAAFALDLTLTRIATIDGRNRRFAHGIAREITILADAFADATVHENVGIFESFPVEDATPFAVPVGA